MDVIIVHQAIIQQSLGPWPACLIHESREEAIGHTEGVYDGKIGLGHKVKKLVSGVLFSRPGTIPILELKSPRERTVNPSLLSLIVSVVTRWKRSLFHWMNPSLLLLWQAM